LGDQSASVVIPTYNRAPLVARAVRSALAAISPGDEVIVVDDGSTDETERVLAPFAGEIRYVRITNGGAGRARNRGVAEARSPLVAFLDSDDEWEPDRLLLGRRLLAARPDVLFCFSDLGSRREGTPDRRKALASWHHDPRPWDEILGPGSWYSSLAELPPGRADFQVHVGDLYAALLTASYVPVQTVLVRRAEAGPALHFGEGLPTYEDWECAARLARAGLAAYLDTETAWQWTHGAPRLTDADEVETATTRIAVVERVWGSDGEFLAREGERVARVLREQQLIRLRGLLGRGQIREARAVLPLVKDAPLSLLTLASLPGPLVRVALALRLAAVRRLHSAGDGAAP
jgi:glycosyltransferase involved in cell wall biosynthesis